MRRIIIPLFLLLWNQPSALGQWQPCSNGLNVSFAKPMTEVGNALLVGTDQGVFRSNMYGDDWSLSSNGLSDDSVVFSLSVHQGRVFCGTSTAIYYSDDNGYSWDLSLYVGFRIMEFAIQDGNLLAVTFGGGCWKTTNNGAAWYVCNNGLQSDSLHSILAVGNDIYLGSRFAGLFRSQDAGESWEAISTGDDSINVIGLLSNGNDLFVGLRVWPSGLHYVKRSSDWGQSWTLLTSPVFPQGQYLLASAGICSGSTILMGYEQLVRSTDNGDTWSGYGNGSLGLTYNGLFETDDYVFLSRTSWQGSQTVYRMPKESVFPVSVGNLESATHSVYPNPAKDRITVQLQKGSIRSVNIWDVEGRMVASEALPTGAGRTEIEIGHLAAGIYTVVTSSDFGALVTRLVKE